MEASDQSPVIFTLMATCQNEKNKKKKCLTLNVKFRDINHYGILEGVSFDVLIGPCNDALDKKYGPGWWVDDVIETYGEAEPNAPVDLDASSL
jgi:hypothetical protein